MKVHTIPKPMPVQTPARPGVAAPRNTHVVVGEDPYLGEELRPFTGRPGAMTAYNLPSRGVKC